MSMEQIDELVSRMLKNRWALPDGFSDLHLLNETTTMRTYVSGREKNNRYVSFEFFNGKTTNTVLYKIQLHKDKYTITADPDGDISSEHVLATLRLVFDFLSTVREELEEKRIQKIHDTNEKIEKLKEEIKSLEGETK